ncbi:MAG TPA: ORF6N domain-containing protein [Candidatus Caccenecus avistercoris]|nr:ORF6N domain-containing protein [Candidatus Caccenecus avistercoris]
MNDIVFKNEEKIENLIYEIRGKQVILDSDLARLYKCANGTKTINLAVKDTLIDFQKDLCFN